MPSLSFPNPISILLLNAVQRVEMNVLDDNGNPLAASSVTLNVYDSGQNLFYTTTYPQNPVKIQNPSTGYYYVNFGSAIPNNETGMSALFYFNWAVTTTAGADAINRMQIVKVITPKTLALTNSLGLQINKAGKLVIQDPVNPLFLGYTLPMLVQFLQGGLHLINSMQPYPTWATVDDFPSDSYGQLLIDMATVVAIRSQEVFAIDTDIPSYSDNGNVFVIHHQPALQSFGNGLADRLEKLVPQMKLQFVQSGSIKIEAGANFRLAQLLSAAPPGATLRGVFTAI